MRQRPYHWSILSRAVSVGVSCGFATFLATLPLAIPDFDSPERTTLLTLEQPFELMFGVGVVASWIVVGAHQRKQKKREDAQRRDGSHQR